MSKSAMHFELALVEAIHEALVAGDELFVPGLGTFSIHHRPAKIQMRSETSAGDSRRKSAAQQATIIEPPENIISFVAESDDDIIPEFKTR